jgi:serine/threonine protein phosphatase PrpC
VSELSGRFKKSYPAGRLSFLVLLDLGGSSVIVLHAGDCRLGMIDVSNGITWLTRAHTLANAVEEIGDEALAQHESRHVLTRSFKPGKQCDLDLSEYDLMAGDNFIIATDGYWADLDDKQRSEFIAKNVVSLSSQRDDVSCLLLSHSPKCNAVQTDEGTENFYLIRG